MVQISKKLGENIKRIRLKSVCRRATCAELLIWTEGYMSAIEGGKVNVTLVVLEKLTNALDVQLISC